MRVGPTFLLFGALVSCAIGDGDGGSVEPALASDRTLVIAPFLAGEYYCDAAASNTSIVTDDDAATLCASIGETAADRVSAALDTLGPQISPSGRYQLGYTLLLPLLRYVKQVNGQATVDQSLLANNLQLISDVDRPVVVYLFADHFADSNSTLPLQLAANNSNLMWTRDGPLATQLYFNSLVIAWTLSDQTAPINIIRRQVFTAAIEAICKLPASAKEKIVGVALLGETHDLFPNSASYPRFSVPSYEATDYSPVAIDGFRRWLTRRYSSIDILNRDLDSNFASINSVNPPSKDIRTEPFNSVFDDIDPYAPGVVPIQGWIFDKLGRGLEVLVYLDGTRVGIAQTGLGRTDVTEAVPWIKDPNVGYRFNLDYRDIAYGVHTLEVLVSANEQPPLRLKKQQLVILDRYQNVPPVIPYVETGAQPMSSDVSLSGTVDGPEPLQSLIHNPLASLWLEYRNYVVRKYIDGYAQLADRSCLPKSKIFSHQILPNLVSNWNGDLLAVDASNLPAASYNPGVSLYGGAAFGRAFLELKQKLGWTLYSVGEMHPQVPLTPDQYLEMFNMHRSNGAVFVAPYYVSMLPGRLSSSGGIGQFRIAPDNPLGGSNLYWQSIRAVMQQ